MVLQSYPWITLITYATSSSSDLFHIWPALKFLTRLPTTSSVSADDFAYYFTKKIEAIRRAFPQAVAIIFTDVISSVVMSSGSSVLVWMNCLLHHLSPLLHVTSVLGLVPSSLLKALLQECFSLLMQPSYKLLKWTLILGSITESFCLF